MLVTDLSLSAMRDALRIKALVREAAPQTRLKILLNQYRPPGKADMPLAEFERSIEDKIACSIPFDPKAMAQAAGAESKGAEALRKASQGLIVAKPKKKRASLFARLFKS
jgi:pilus assembly protein CpaE